MLLPNEAEKTASRKRKQNVNKWKRNVRKAKKLRGETHVNTVGISVLAKEPLPVN